ncbi:MAG: AAA family ATPase [bacterium]
MKKLPIGIQDFDELISRGCVYVDKTKHIFNLIESGKYYFLSRPRRFGKSLLISVLKEIFAGNSNLFRGLWIENRINWDTYPVLRIDFSSMDYKNQKLDSAIIRNLVLQSEIHGVELIGNTYKEKFYTLVRKLGSERKVVLLIDEYDKPIVDYLTKTKKAVENREILKNFYSSIKSLDPYLKFVFITGVSKFSKVSLFSDLNNLNDITSDQNYSDMLGYTAQEIIRYFPDHLSETSNAMGKVRQELLDVMREWYNGYSWDGKKFVYNPFSILNFFSKHSFDNFWFSTGTPTFLVDYIREHGINTEKLEEKKVPAVFFDKFDIENLDIISVMFQTGYLTIKEVENSNTNRERYILSYPNEEVRISFLHNLLESYAHSYLSATGEALINIEDALINKDIESFIENLRTLFASIPYDLFIANMERYYHSIIFITLRLIGVNIDTEIHTNKGRIDAVIHTDSFIYIIEFKLDSAKNAMAQIHKNRYYERYVNDTRKIVLLAIGFSKEERNIGEWIETIHPS